MRPLFPHRFNSTRAQPPTAPLRPPPPTTAEMAILALAAAAMLAAAPGASAQAGNGNNKTKTVATCQDLIPKVLAIGSR